HPFSLTSTVTLTGESTSKVLHNTEIVAVNAHGDLLRKITKFDSPTSTVPYGEITRLAEAPDGVFHAVFKGGGASYSLQGKSKRALREHQLVENQCTAPDPGLKLVGASTVMIGSVAHPVLEVSDTA